MDCCSISTLLYGQQLISGDMRRTVEHFIEDTHLCSAEGRGSIHEFVDLDLPQTVTSTISIAVSPDGHTFASTHGDHSVRVFQCLTGALVRTFTGHPRTPWTVKYHPIDSNVIASGCLGYQVRVWDIRKNCCIAQLRMDYSVISIAFHPLGEYLAMAYGTCVDLWCYQTGVTSASNPSEVRRMIHTRSIRAVLFHPSGRYLLAAAPDVPMRSSDTPSYCRLFVCTYDDFFAVGVPSAKEMPPIELTTCPVLVDQIFVYSEGGLDLSPDGSLLLTCALVHQLRRDDADDAADHSSSSSSARHPRMHNVSPHSHSEMINSNERYRGRLPVTVSSLTAATAPRVHLTYDPNPAPSAPVSFSTSNIRIARNAARLRAMTAASYRNFIESNGPDISALDIGQLGGDIIMNTSINTNSRPRNVITSSNSRHSSSYINYPYNHTSHHRVLNSGAPNSISAHRTDSSASSFTTAVPSQRSSLHPNAGAISTTTDPPTHAFPLLPPQRWDHNVPPFQGHVDRKDDDSLGLSSPVSADTIPTGAMEPLSMNPLPSLSTSVLGDMNSSLLGSHHGNQHQMQQAHRPSILPNNITEGRRRYQLNYHMSSIEDLSHSRVVSSDTSDLSFNREDSSHTAGGRWISEDRLSLFRLSVIPGEGEGEGGSLEAVLLQTKYLPLALLKAVTSTKLSPTGRYALVGYGVRQAGLVLGHSHPDATCEVLSLVDHMSSVAVFCDEEDEINVALFHPSPGLGIVYGTQKGKLRTRLTSRRCDRL